MTKAETRNRGQIMHPYSILHSTVLCCALGCTTLADNWPQFRGPHANGEAAGTPPPLEWSADKNNAWSVPIPGSGHSCPIVWDNKVFLTTAVPVEGDDKTLRFNVLCLDATSGELLWSRTAREMAPPFPTHRSNSYATETPVTDGKHLYVCFGRIGLFCYSLEGELVWEQPLKNVPMLKGWGSASSPALHDGTLFLQCDNEAESFLVAYEANTGKERWRVERPEPSSYGSPVAWQNSLRTEIVTSGLKARGYDPGNGALLWELDLRGGRNSCTPSPSGDQIYLGNESRNKGDIYDGGGFLFAVKAGASGDISIASEATSGGHVAWVAGNSGISMASPIAAGGNVYVFNRGNGLLNAYAEKDGSPVLSKQRLPNARKFWASPWAYDGHVFAADDQGTTFVIRSGSTFELTGTNALDAIIWASPAIANSALYIRSLDRLFCIRR